MLNVKEMLTIIEAADILDVSTRSVNRYIKEGKLKAYKIGGKWRFEKEEIERFIRGEQA